MFDLFLVNFDPIPKPDSLLALHDVSENLFNMPKARVKVSKLFHNKLSDNTMAIVRVHFPDWYQGYKKYAGEPKNMSMELVQDFVEQLCVVSLSELSSDSTSQKVL